MSIRKRAIDLEICGGTWINLGSSVSSEIAAHAGFDWLLVDMEHGIGSYETLLHQLQAMNGSPAASIVRVQDNDWAQIKKVLDYGASGVMIPFVQSKAEAEKAVANMKYFPKGNRGAAKFTRACQFGVDFDHYFAKANQDILTIVQIETPESVAQADEIASVDGVDVLFVGPLDLTVTKFGETRQVSMDAISKELNIVAAACQKHGKACGTLLANPADVVKVIDMGYTFNALGSDGGCVVQGLRGNAKVFNELK